MEDGSRLHPRRTFVEIGLFSELFKPEVNDYIAFRSKARPEGFHIRKPSSRAITVLSAYFVNNISIWECAGSGAQGLSERSELTGAPLCT